MPSEYRGEYSKKGWKILLCVRLFAYIFFATHLLAACGGETGGNLPGNSAAGVPRITSLTIASNNSDRSIAHVGDMVSVRLTTNESIFAPVVIIGGSLAHTVNGSGSIWLASRPALLSDTSGNLAITVRYSDFQANINATSATTDGSAVRYIPPRWEMIWAEEFNGTALNMDNWNIQAGDGCPNLCGWGNREQQYYSTDNISVANGMLTITAREESKGGRSFTSARINTKNKFDFTYGRVEVRAQLPAGLGTWPAAWMLPTSNTYGIWPLSGEIDIVESTNLGVNNKKTITGTSHYGMLSPLNSFTSNNHEPSANPQDAMHTYAMEWSRDHIRYFFDDTHYATQTSANWYTTREDGRGGYEQVPAMGAMVSPPFDQSFHILLNLAVGGNLTGNPAMGELNTTFGGSGQTYDVDYVRVFRCVDNDRIGHGVGCRANASSSVRAISSAHSPTFKRLAVYPANGGGLHHQELVSGAIATNTLQVARFASGTATVSNDVQATDSGETVWNVQISGNVGNVSLLSATTPSAALRPNFDLSGTQHLGNLVFNMKVNAIGDNTTLTVKLGNGFPNSGEKDLVVGTVGEWTTYTIKIADLTPIPGGTLDLTNVRDLFVIEATDTVNMSNTRADVNIDNIVLTAACRGADCRLNAIPFFNLGPVFVNSTIANTWSEGFAGFDAANSFTTDCIDDGGAACPSLMWQLVDDAQRLGRKVIEVTHPNASATMFSGLTIGRNSLGVDFTGFEMGQVLFDLKVVENPMNAQFVMKVDCVGCPTTAAGEREQNLGMIATGEWTSQSVNISALIAANGGSTAGGLKIDKVLNGMVIFPASEGNKFRGVRYRVDNVRWVRTGGTTTAPTPTPARPLGQAGVFADAIHAQWSDSSLTAWDGAINNICSSSAACPTLDWEITTATAEATTRNQVVRVVHSAEAPTVAVLIMGQRGSGLDFTAFSAGQIKFDVYYITANVTTQVFVVKADCAGCSFDNAPREIDSNVVMPSNHWQEISIQVQDIINANGGPDEGQGLKIDRVTTGMVIRVKDSSGTFTYELDNVRWEQ